MLKSARRPTFAQSDVSDGFDVITNVVNRQFILKEGQFLVSSQTFGSLDGSWERGNLIQLPLAVLVPHLVNLLHHFELFRTFHVPEIASSFLIFVNLHLIGVEGKLVQSSSFALDQKLSCDLRCVIWVFGVHVYQS